MVVEIGKAAAGCGFDEGQVLMAIRHYLPEQAPLKDFVHHNTLHAFQDRGFFEATREAATLFGYAVVRPLADFREDLRCGRIDESLLDAVLQRRHPGQVELWKRRMLESTREPDQPPRIGQLRSRWLSARQLDMDALVHPLLFRVLCSYLDQGIAVWTFPHGQGGFLEALRELERNSLNSLFHHSRARQLLLQETPSIAELLRLLVGDERLYARYLFDQQFAHPGWSGMAAVIESHPEVLIDQRLISLADLVRFELLLEIDALDNDLGKGWQPLARGQTDLPLDDLLAPVADSEYHQVMALWQEVAEWSFYEPVLSGLSQAAPEDTVVPVRKSFQGLFCIDDRICSLRRHIEQLDPQAETFGTPGFFNVAFEYQPAHGQSRMRLCPGSVTPRHLIRELDVGDSREAEPHLSKHSHNLLGGWWISHTLGLWSAVRLFCSIFRPALSPAMASSFRHMHPHSTLTIEHRPEMDSEAGLQVGFTLAEMADSCQGLLTGIGLTGDFAELVYVVGHGASSVNNPHYSAYDCGACSGRPGSVNARVISFMLNHAGVRRLLDERGLRIPDATHFVGALHDTTRDEMVFYDTEGLSAAQQSEHARHVAVLEAALARNAQERSRRFELVDSQAPLARVHAAVRRRSVSLFEPRPELNHATNALCVIGRRGLTRGLFLDRRSFLNSYDWRQDPDGEILRRLLRPIGPVCGGINLEYYFSCVDNRNLGAGTKLPHNVMGLIGVANGPDGDLRTGLPSQMIEVHTPIRMLVIIEQSPALISRVLEQEAASAEWFVNGWLNLVAVDPRTRQISRFEAGQWVPHVPLQGPVPAAGDLQALFARQTDNLPIYALP